MNLPAPGPAEVLLVLLTVFFVGFRVVGFALRDLGKGFTAWLYAPLRKHCVRKGPSLSFNKGATSVKLSAPVQFQLRPVDMCKMLRHAAPTKNLPPVLTRILQIMRQKS